MKQLFTRFLLLAALSLGVTTVWAQKSVLSESFAGGSLPSGWAAGSYWIFSEGNAKFFDPFENAADTLFSPMVDVSELQNVPTLTFAYSLTASGSKVNQLTLLYRTSADGEWGVYKSFSTATDGRTEFTQALPEGLSTLQVAIAGKYLAGGDTYVYQIQLANKKEATVAPSDFKTESLTSTSVKLTWKASESDYFQRYNLKVGTSPLDNPEIEVGDVANFFGESGLTEGEWYELGNLSPDTKYYAYVQYDCGDGDVSPWAELEFKTLCEAVAVPFYEDFENGLSDCFTVYKKGSATTAEVSGEYPYNSTRSFKVAIAGTNDFSNYLVLPELTGDISNYQISFMAASSETGNTLSRRVTVGVCIDPTDVAGSFSAITTLDLPKGRSWENIIVSLKGYSGSGKYITLKIGHPSQGTNLYIDDIKVEVASSCPKPMFVQTTGVTTSTATIGWTKTGSETEWNLVVSTKPLADPEEIEPSAAKGEFAGSVSVNPYTLSGLKPNTTYYAYIQAGCGSSEWTEAVTFKTQREVTYPYAEHFDRMDPELYTNNTAAIPSGWVFDDRTTLASDASYYDRQYTSETYRPYVTTVQNHEATAYVKASLLLKGTSSGTGGTKNISSIAIAPAMPKPVNTMMVTFWAYASSAQTVKIGVANTQTNDLPQGRQLGANITEVGEAAIAGGSEWKQYKVLLTGYTGTGRYIAFYLKPGTSTPNVYIDDIEIDEAPNCNAVSTLTAEATGIDKATVEWTDASSSTSWTIRVSSTEIDPASADGDIIAGRTVNAKTYNLTGLSMGQTYYIYVSPSCGDAWMSTTVTTLVGLQVPYYNDFTSENTGANATRGPKNWKLGYTYTDSPGNTSSNWPYVNTTAWTNPPADVVKNSLYLSNTAYASGQYPYAIMPELLNADVKDLKILFYLYTTLTTNLGTAADPYYDELKIGVVSSPSDINKTDKFTKVTNVATVRAKASKVAQNEVVDMSAYAGTGKYIVFYQELAKANHSYIDNLYVLDKNAPLPPAAVADVAASEITKTTATITWTEKGEATQWNVRVFDAAQDDPSAGTPISSTIVNNKPSANITGLSASTQYYAYVQSVQSNGNGAWVNATFFTECDVFPIPFAEDWESWSTGANTLSACFTQTAGMQVASSGSPNATVKTGQVIKFNATSTNKEPMLVLPAFDKPIKTLQLTMNASPYTSSYVGDASYTEIGVLEAGDNFVKIAEYRFNLSDVKAWDEVFVNFSAYTGEGGRIAIRSSYVTAGNKTTHICFDNLLIEEIPLCGKITTIEANDIDSTSATISWAKGKAENKWNLKVSSTELDDPATATADIFDGQLDVQNKALTGLDGNTTYYVYVQSVDETLECTGAWSNAKTFKTLCKLQTFPYEEDFEDFETGSGKDLGCFIQCGEDANPSYVSTKGSKALWLRQATKDHNNYFVFPALAIDSVKRLQLSMQVYVGTTATYTYPFEVGVMTDPNDPATFVATHSEALAGQTAAYDRVYTFEGYAGDETGEKFGTFIALKPLNYKNASNVEYANNAIYIDNVTIDFIETCFKPTDVTGEIGTDTVKLSWNSDNEGASYLVRVFGDKDADPETATPLAETTVTDKEAVIRGLTGNTMYYAYVQALCSETDKSKWSTVYQFKTECPATCAIPYVENFDGETELITDYCWTSFKIQGSTACTTDYNAKVSTSAKKDGTRGLYLQYTNVDEHAGGSCVGTHRSAAVTPALDVESLKELVLYFDVKSNTTTKATVKIEAVSDETIDAEAIYIATIENIGDSWQKAYVNLSQLYTSVLPYKRLRFSTTTTNASAYIDNLVITNDLNVVLPVEELKLQMLSESTIKFSFTEFTPSINQWQVAYVVAGGDIADAKIQTIDATEYTITGLAPNTTYDIYVRGNVEGDQWVGPLTATTIQTPAPLPLITGFEDAEDNAKWDLYNVQTVQGNFYPNFWIVGGADKCAGTGNNALFITNDSASYQAYGNDSKMNPTDYPWMSSVTSSSSVWATRNIKIEDVGTYKFGFKIKVPSTYGTSYSAYAQLIPAGATFKAGSATLISGTTRSGSATKNENGCYVVMNSVYNTPEWKWVNTSIDIETPGIYTLAIYWTNSSAVAANPYETGAAIDSVIVEEYLCTTPKDIKFANRTATEVSIQWFGGKCKEFEYVVSKYANLGMPNLIDEEDKVAYGTLNDGPQVTIKDLIPNSAYSFYVRTICPDGYTDWIEYDFETPCALEELPYTESFSEIPECWILKSASATTANYKTPEMETAEKWTCLQLNNGGLAILPELAVDLKNVEVELALFNSTSLGAVQLGVMDNTWDASTFKEIAFFQTVNKLTSTSSGNPYVLETFSKMMNLYQGTGKVLAIKNATSNTVYVKYVKLTELPDCVKPQQVELTFIKDSEVTVNWLAGLEEAWEIKVNESIIENVTTNPYRITGLEQGTVYTVAVRALCDENTKSEWSQSTTFQTKCGINSLPMFENFSSLPNPPGTTNLARAALTCWDNMVSTLPIEQVAKGNDVLITPASNVYAGNLWVQNWISALGDYAQLQSYHNTSSVPYRYKWFVSPQYAIEGNASLSFEARVCNNKGETIPDSVSNNDRTFVAISTDNGATWKMEDATNISAQLTGEYKTINISLDKYAGKNIRVAFYSENVSGTSTKNGELPFVLIDNVRMNCSENVALTDNACEGYDYERNGFTIKAEDLPMEGADSTYTRFAKGEGNDCDTTFVLTLITRAKPQIAPIYATICHGEGYKFGSVTYYEPNPEGQPYYINGETQYGCDSTIYLYLTVQPSDTTDMTPQEPIAIENSQLPYRVDDYYTIPEDAQVGLKFDTIIKTEGCSFNKYSVTVSRCVEQPAYAATICEGEVGYIGYGFSLVKDDLPAVGESKVYTRNGEHNATICDSIVTLTLTVHKNDTTSYADAICQSATLYEGNGFALAQDQLPAPGQTLTFYRTETSEVYEGCDSIITLDLTVYKNDTTVFADAICQSETAYSGYGFTLNTDELPVAGTTQTYFRTEQDLMNAGCDSIVALLLTVLTYDTIDQPAVAIKYEQLPYALDEFYTIGTDAQVGEKFEVVVRQGETSCTFFRYAVLISDCVREASYAETICEDQLTYSDYGFEIGKADMPAPGTNKQFTRQTKDVQGCDSLISLTLTVLKGDTTIVPVAIQNIDLPYVVDAYYTVPADAAIGEPFVVTVKTDAGECSFNTYEVEITKCEIPVSYDDAICSDQLSYAGYGFSIEAAELPAPGESKVYSRHALDEVGCDSVITFTLTVVANDTTVIPVAIDNTQLPYVVDNFYTVPEGTPLGEPYELVVKIDDCTYNKYEVSVIQCTRTFRFAEMVCQDQTSFTGFGFTISEAQMPAAGESLQFSRSNMSEQGCDSLITLTLSVKANDTIDIAVERNNAQLPYVVNDYYTVPADAPIGETFEEIRKAGDDGCTYYRYIVTITQCEQAYNFADVACPDEAYVGFGFAVAAADLPAIGETKQFNRNAMSPAGCDSIITLTLTVAATEVADVTVEIDNAQLPYVVDDYYTVPADAPVGESFEVIVKTADGTCTYNRYIVTVSRCTEPFNYEDAICADQTSYEGYGFAIGVAELPAVEASKEYMRTASGEVCDSVITLTLTVWQNDTIDHLPAVEVLISELPYVVDGVELLPADMEEGEYSIIIKSETDDCAYDRYYLNVLNDKDAIEYTTDDMRDVVLYDVLGHKVAEVDEPAHINALDLPSGVYMIRTTKQNGAADCGKFISK